MQARGIAARFFIYTFSMGQLEERVFRIESRNKSVEADKAWEISWTRRALIALFTYIVVGIFLTLIRVANPWINALVPVIGFTLSTVSLPFFKRLWIDRLDSSKPNT